MIVSSAEEQANIQAKRADIVGNRRRYDVLSKIVKDRQRRRMRREALDAWVRIGVPFLSGAGGILLSPAEASIWSSIRAALH
jgi:hypothetical protein